MSDTPPNDSDSVDGVDSGSDSSKTSRRDSSSESEIVLGGAGKEEGSGNGGSDTAEGGADSGQKHEGGTSQTRHEEINEDDEPNYSSWFKENVFENNEELKEATPIPALMINEELISFDVDIISDYILKEEEFVIIYGETYVDEVSLGTVIRIDDVKQEFIQGELHFRDIINDLILERAADDLIDLFHKEIKTSDTVRIVLSMGQHKKLCEMLLRDSYLERLRQVFNNKEATLLLCIQQDQNQFPDEVLKTLKKLNCAFHVNWPEILIKFWQDSIQLGDSTPSFLLGTIVNAIQRTPKKAPRAAISLRSAQLDDIESAENKSEHLQTLIFNAFVDSQANEARQLQEMVEKGWQKPLKKQLLALYSLMSRKPPVQYQLLKSWGTTLLQGLEIRYPIPQQQSTEVKTFHDPINQPASIIHTSHQYVDAKAEILWQQYFDELLDECHIAIDRNEDYGLVLNAADASIEWLVEQYYRRYPGAVREIFDLLIHSEKLFPAYPSDEQTRAASINTSYKTARLLLCIHNLDGREYPIAVTLKHTLDQGIELIYQRIQQEKVQTPKKLGKTKEANIWDLVSMGIAYYLQEIRNNVTSLEEYRSLLDAAYTLATEKHDIARLLLNAFSFLVDQERFATLDYLFQFLNSSRDENHSEELWATLRRVFAFHMRNSLDDRLAILWRLSEQIPEHKEYGIVIMTYSRLWFDAIRSDYNRILVNTENTFASLCKHNDQDKIMELLRHYKRIDQSLVATTFPDHRAIARNIANMMLSGFPEDSVLEMMTTLDSIRNQLAKGLLLQYQEQIQQKIEIIEDFYSRSSPMVRLHKLNTFSQTKEGISFGQTWMRIYHRFFAIALAEWGSGAAGIHKGDSPAESKNILTCYFNALNESLSNHEIKMICDFWREAGKHLEYVERDTKPPEGANSHYQILYGELKSLLRKKINRYRKMAEYLLSLNNENQTKDLTK